MAKTPAPAKTPGVAIARALRGLGLKQGTDFRVKGVYSNGERTGTRVAVYGTDANAVVANHADAIEEAVKADGGWTMQVSIFFAPGGAMWVGVDNYNTRVRQTHMSSHLGRTEQVAPAAVSAPVVGDSGRTMTQKPVLRATVGEPRPAFQDDPLRPVTPEEARAAVVKRFPRGTAVRWMVGAGRVRHGRVNGLDVGTVTDPGHVNDGRVYLGVDVVAQRTGDPTVRTRLFADTLTEA
jgi:hypothetical protein